MTTDDATFNGHSVQWLNMEVEPGFIRVPFKVFGVTLFWLTKQVWRLTKDFVEREGGRVVRIPKGYIFDGASIPLVGRAFLTATEALVAACGHDWRYAGNVAECSRKEADRVFYRVMVNVQVPPWRAKIGYLGVRAGGWASWKGD